MAKGKFTPELAAKLKEAAERKRRLNPKACDYEPADWVMAADWVKEHSQLLLFIDSPPTHGRTLRHVPKECVEALATTVPITTIRYELFGSVITMPVFSGNFLIEVLARLKLDSFKYSKARESRTVARLRIDNP